MTTQTHSEQAGLRIWRWPVDVTVYDRSPHLTAEEMDALAFALEYRNTAKRYWILKTSPSLERLYRPI